MMGILVLNEKTLKCDFVHPYDITIKELTEIDNFSTDKKTDLFRELLLKYLSTPKKFRILYKGSYRWAFNTINQECITINGIESDTGSFLAVMSHEIRTPLNGIDGMITLLEHTKLSAEQKDYISTLRECSTNLLGIVCDILDFSKLENKQVIVEPTDTVVRKCIESVNGIISNKLNASGGLNYSFSIDNNVPYCMYVDEKRLKQVLKNLLENAIKFTKDGDVTLKVYMVPGEVGIVYFDITDTGRGIDILDIDSLFKPFNRVDDIVTKLYQGTGLGLTICKDLVELMGGNIYLSRSVPGIGSTFTFWVRYEECNRVQQENWTFTGKKILVIDDKYENRLHMSKMLMKTGADVSPFSSACEALHFCNDVLYDLAIVDICMPKVSGPMFVDRLRQLENGNKNLPVIASSSLGDKNLYNHTIFCSHVTKPIVEDVLFTRMSQVFSKKRVIERKESIKVNTDLKILVAEDDSTNRKVIKGFLEKTGLKNITIVTNGQDAISKIKNESFDVIFLDIRMPEASGFEVVNYIRNRESKKSRKSFVVAVTALYTSEEKNKEFKHIGFDDYLPKPVNLLDTIECLERAAVKLSANKSINKHTPA